MVRRSHGFLYRAASVLALALMIAGCTKGGQFDPTEIFNSDVFDSKKKLRGDRTAVFPEGVPGTATGVPAELVKGYEPPAAPAASAPGPAPTRITVGNTQRPAATGQQPGGAQTAWPAPPSTSSQQPAQSSQSGWPAPPQTPTAQPAQSSQSVWPDPPAAAGS